MRQSLTLTQIAWSSLSCRDLFICGIKMPAKWKYGLEGFYGTLKSMSMAIMDALSMATVQTLSLQQMRREAAIESAPKGSLQRQRESFVLLHSPLSYCLTDRLVPFTRRMWLRTTNFLLKRPLPIRLSVTHLLLLLLPESLRLNLARIRLSLTRLLLIRLNSLTLVFIRSSDLI